MSYRFEPEDFLETLDRTIEMNEELLAEFKADESTDLLVEDLTRLRELRHRICVQFGIEEIIWH